MMDKKIEELVMFIEKLKEEIKEYEKLGNTGMIQVNKDLIKKSEGEIGRRIVMMIEAKESIKNLKDSRVNDTVKTKVKKSIFPKIAVRTR